MKKTIKNLVTVVIALTTIYLLNACKKTTVAENTICTVSKTSMAGAYKLAAMRYRANPTSAEVDFMPFVENCEKDDLLILNANGTYTYTDLAVVCNPNGTENGNWDLVGDILTCSSGGILNGKLVSFDCKKLVYSVDNTLAPNDKTIVTLTKQ
jgi:Lipocalin-like domain